MTTNASWAQWGWHGNDPRFSPLPLLNGGVRRAFHERKAWSSYQHTSVTQACLLSGVASSDSTTLADVTKSDFLANLDTLPSENYFSGIKPMLQYLRTLVENNSLYPSIRTSDGYTGDEHIIASQLPSNWAGSYYVDGQFLRDAGLVETDGTSYWVKRYRFLRLHEGYTMVRKFLDFWLYIPVSICAWMRTADTSSNTITASQDLLGISPHGWWICGYRNAGVSQATYRKYALTDNVPMDTSTGTYAPTVRLYLDGRDFLKFQADT